MTAPTFRRAVEADWPSVWRVFHSVVAGGDTYTYPPELTEGAARSEWLHVGEDRTVTFVAELDGEIVGTALLKPNLGGLGDHVANAGWMIAPEAAGRGVGRHFAEHVLDEARRLGFTGMQFNAVVATNDRALRLWRSLDFDEVGRVPGAFRHRTEGFVDLVIMHRSL
ncbi:MAG: GNAT family N-acetyltransferase [Ilumatobacter sp.]|nr:GNAT family N-acetyltransferase [Ilumatobacter sp.]